VGGVCRKAGKCVTGWGRIGGRVEDGGESGWKGAERVVGMENNALCTRK
jgi:hypothetical protein